MKIGFIGLGIMGKPMAKNLLKAGYTDLLVNNRSQAPVQELEAAGAKGATQQEIGEQCDVVITMLPNSPQVKEVMLGANGVASHMKPGAVFIDCSSINPVASKEIYAELQKKGVEMLDAPVSGGEPKAIDGTLSFMVGGKQVFQAIKGGLAGSTVMNAKAPMMIAGNDKPGFKIDLHIKDLNNVLDCAHAVGAPVPMTAEVQEIMQWLHNHEGGQKDHSAIAQYYEYLTGIQIGR